jgi:hypothetical protein
VVAVVVAVVHGGILLHPRGQGPGICFLAGHCVQHQ